MRTAVGLPCDGRRQIREANVTGEGRTVGRHAFSPIIVCYLSRLRGSEVRSDLRVPSRPIFDVGLERKWRGRAVARSPFLPQLRHEQPTYRRNRGFHCHRETRLHATRWVSGVNFLPLRRDCSPERCDCANSDMPTRGDSEDSSTRDLDHTFLSPRSTQAP